MDGQQAGRCPVSRTTRQPGRQRRAARARPDASDGDDPIRSSFTDPRPEEGGAALRGELEDDRICVQSRVAAAGRSPTDGKGVLQRPGLARRRIEQELDRAARRRQAVQRTRSRRGESLGAQKARRLAQGVDSGERDGGAGGVAPLLQRLAALDRLDRLAGAPRGRRTQSARLVGQEIQRAKAIRLRVQVLVGPRVEKERDRLPLAAGGEPRRRARRSVARAPRRRARARWSRPAAAVRRRRQWVRRRRLASAPATRAAHPGRPRDRPRRRGHRARGEDARPGRSTHRPACDRSAAADRPPRRSARRARARTQRRPACRSATTVALRTTGVAARRRSRRRAGQAPSARPAPAPRAAAAPSGPLRPRTCRRAVDPAARAPPAPPAHPRAPLPLSAPLATAAPRAQSAPPPRRARSASPRKCARDTAACRAARRHRHRAHAPRSHRREIAPRDPRAPPTPDPSAPPPPAPAAPESARLSPER